jgi:hypothetical protein
VSSLGPPYGDVVLHARGYADQHVRIPTLFDPCPPPIALARLP